MKISRGKIYKILLSSSQTKKNKRKKRLGKRKHKKPHSHNKKKRKHLKNISLRRKRHRGGARLKKSQSDSAEYNERLARYGEKWEKDLNNYWIFILGKSETAQLTPDGWREAKKILEDSDALKEAKKGSVVGALVNMFQRTTGNRKNAKESLSKQMEDFIEKEQKVWDKQKDDADAFAIQGDYFNAINNALYGAQKAGEESTDSSDLVTEQREMITRVGLGVGMEAYYDSKIIEKEQAFADDTDKLDQAEKKYLKTKGTAETMDSDGFKELLTALHDYTTTASHLSTLLSVFIDAENDNAGASSNESLMKKQSSAVGVEVAQYYSNLWKEMHELAKNIEDKLDSTIDRIKPQDYEGLQIEKKKETIKNLGSIKKTTYSVVGGDEGSFDEQAGKLAKAAAEANEARKVSKYAKLANKATAAQTPISNTAAAASPAKKHDLYQKVDTRCDGKNWSDVREGAKAPGPNIVDNIKKETDNSQRNQLVLTAEEKIVSLCIPERTDDAGGNYDMFKKPFRVQKSRGDGACGFHTVAWYLFKNCVQGVTINSTNDNPINQQTPPFNIPADLTQRTNYYTKIHAAANVPHLTGDLKTEWRTVLDSMLVPGVNTSSSIGSSPPLYQNDVCLKENNRFKAFLRKYVKAYKEGIGVNKKDIQEWEKKDVGGKQDEQLNDEDFQPLAYILQNTIASVKSLEGGDWTYYNPVSSFLRYGIVIPHDAADDYPAPCMMLHTEGSTDSATGTEAVKRLNSGGHFDVIYLLDGPNQDGGFNEFKTKTDGDSGEVAYAVDMYNKEKGLSMHNKNVSDENKPGAEKTQTDCKAYADKVKEIVKNTGSSSAATRFFKGNIVEPEGTYLDYFSIFFPRTSNQPPYPTFDELNAKIKELSGKQQAGETYNKSPKISKIFNGLTYKDKELTQLGQDELIGIFFPSKDGKLDEDTLKRNYDTLKEIDEACKLEKETAAPTADTTTPPEPQEDELSKKVKAIDDRKALEENMNDSKTGCPPLLARIKEEEGKADRGEKFDPEWGHMFPGYCSDRGKFIDYFSTLGIEKPDFSLENVPDKVWDPWKGVVGGAAKRLSDETKEANKKNCFEEAKITLTNKKLLSKYLSAYNACGPKQITASAADFDYEKDPVLESKEPHCNIKMPTDVSGQLLFGDCTQAGKYVNYFKVLKLDKDKTSAPREWSSDIPKQVNDAFNSRKTEIKTASKNDLKGKTNVEARNQIIKTKNARIKCIQEARKVLSVRDTFEKYVKNVYNLCLQHQKKIVAAAAASKSLSGRETTTKSKTAGPGKELAELPEDASDDDMKKAFIESGLTPQEAVEKVAKINAAAAVQTPEEAKKIKKQMYDAERKKSAEGGGEYNKELAELPEDASDDDMKKAFIESGLTPQEAVEKVAKINAAAAVQTPEEAKKIKKQMYDAERKQRSIQNEIANTQGSVTEGVGTGPTQQGQLRRREPVQHQQVSPTMPGAPNVAQHNISHLGATTIQNARIDKDTGELIVTIEARMPKGTIINMSGPGGTDTESALKAIMRQTGGPGADTNRVSSSPQETAPQETAPQETAPQETALPQQQTPSAPPVVDKSPPPLQESDNQSSSEEVDSALKNKCATYVKKPDDPEASISEEDIANCNDNNDCVYSSSRKECLSKDDDRVTSQELEKKNKDQSTGATSQARNDAVNPTVKADATAAAKDKTQQEPEAVIARATGVFKSCQDIVDKTDCNNSENCIYAETAKVPENVNKCLPFGQKAQEYISDGANEGIKMAIETVKKNAADLAAKTDAIKRKKEQQKAEAKAVTARAAAAAKSDTKGGKKQTKKRKKRKKRQTRKK